MQEFSYADIARMRRVNVRDVYRRGSELLDEVDEGGPVLITRNGRPIAVLAPITDPALRRRKALLPAGASEMEDIRHRTRPKAMPTRKSRRWM